MTETAEIQQEFEYLVALPGYRKASPLLLVVESVYIVEDRVA